MSKKGGPPKKMENGLLHMELIEWCPVRFYAQAHKLYLDRCKRAKPQVKDPISRMHMVSIWRGVGKTIEMQMAKGKGTKIDGIGIFTLDVAGNPAFFPDPLFYKIYGLCSHRKPIKGNTLNAPVQFMTVNKVVRGGALRDDTEQVLEAIPNTIRWALDHEISSFAIQVGPVGEFVVGQGPANEITGVSEVIVGMRFNEDFLELIAHARGTRRPMVAGGDSRKNGRRPVAGLGAQIQKRQHRARLESARRVESVGGARMGGGGGDQKGIRGPAGAYGGREGGNRAAHHAVAGAASAAGGSGGNGASFNGDHALAILRSKLFARHGIYAARDTRRTLEIIDDSGDGEVSPKELSQGFRILGLVLHPKIVGALFEQMDRDGSGSLSIGELYGGIRGNMSRHRLKLVQRCFDALVARARRSGQMGADNVRRDAVSVGFLEEAFDCEEWPDVKTGKRRVEDERIFFLSQIDGNLVAPKDGYISREKFVDFYEDINGGFQGGDDDGDDFFTFFVRSTWSFWDMKGFEPLIQADEGLDTFAANEDVEDDFAGNYDEPSGGRPDSAGSSRSSSSSSSSSSHLNANSGGGGNKKKTKKKRSKKQQQMHHPEDMGVPWECNHAWTHQEMRTSLASEPHRPLPRLGSKAAAAASAGAPAAEKEEGGRSGSGGGKATIEGLELIESVPPYFFGDLRLLLDSHGASPPVDAHFVPPNDHWNELRRGLFQPAVGFHEFCRNLGLSGIEENPPVSFAALASRIYEAGRKVQNYSSGKENRQFPRRWTQRMARAAAQRIMDDASRAKWRPHGGGIGRAQCQGEDDDDDDDDESEGGLRSVHPKAVPVLLGRDGNAVPAKWLHGRLCALFGRDRASAKPKSVLDRLRKTLTSVCGPFGLGELRRYLTVMDEDGNLTLDRDELKKGLVKMGLTLNTRELEEVFWEFDRDSSGDVSYSEFMDGIRGPLASYRARLAEEAWDHLGGGSGANENISVKDLCAHFDCHWYPSVAEFDYSGGERGVDPEDIEDAFAERFRRAEVTEVDFDEFMQFHHDFSATIDSDRIFEAFIRNTWHLPSN